MENDGNKRHTDSTIFEMSNAIGNLNAKFDSITDKLDTILPVVEKVIRHDEKIEALARHSSNHRDDIEALQKSVAITDALQSDNKVRETAKTTTLTTVISVTVSAAVGLLAAWIDRTHK